MGCPLRSCASAHLTQTALGGGGNSNESGGCVDEVNCLKGQNRIRDPKEMICDDERLLLKRQAKLPVIKVNSVEHKRLACICI